MVPKAVLVVSVFALSTIVFAGCFDSDRNIRDEAKDRERFAREHNDYDPIAFLSGPDHIAPGALVWYSAFGSHDPDFFGAREDDLRADARRDGGARVQSEYGDAEYSWYWDLADGGDSSLGVGIREYRWRINDGSTYVAHELTERYGSLDGPVRFPLGFTEPGLYSLMLQVIDWSGAQNTAYIGIRVDDDGIGSQIPGWSVTEDGWVFARDVAVDWQQYGECPMVNPGHYDPVQHHVAVPWDLIFFMDTVTVEATWEKAAAPGPLDMLATNLNDVDLTLGHCEQGDVWARFETDTTIDDDELREGGDVAGDEFARNVEITGRMTQRLGEWDFNAYLSDTGDGQWGPGTSATVRFLFVPAPPGATAYGGL